LKPGTYTQLYIQIIFAVKNRDVALKKTTRKIIFKYMSGIISKMNHKSIIINGASDHVHIFIGLNPTKSISDTVRDIKRSTSKYINKEKLCNGRFEWQEGYGAFSYSRSQINSVYNYILKQEEHHKKRTFKDEYIDFLEKYGIEYNHKYLFEFR